MRKQTFIYLWSALLLALSLFFQPARAASSNAPARIDWLTNIEQALDEAEQDQKPVFILFEGSDWCGWCKRLDQEVLDTPQFAQLMKGKMVFVRLDFPLRNPLPPDQTAYNNQAKMTYGINGFPTVVILDYQGRRLTNMGYMAGGPANYAKQIQAVIDR